MEKKLHISLIVIWLLSIIAEIAMVYSKQPNLDNAIIICTIIIVIMSIILIKDIITIWAVIVTITVIYMIVLVIVIIIISDLTGAELTSEEILNIANPITLIVIVGTIIVFLIKEYVVPALPSIHLRKDGRHKTSYTWEKIPKEEQEIPEDKKIAEINTIIEEEEINIQESDSLEKIKKINPIPELIKSSEEGINYFCPFCYTKINNTEIKRCPNCGAEIDRTSLIEIKEEE